MEVVSYGGFIEKKKKERNINVTLTSFKEKAPLSFGGWGSDTAFCLIISWVERFRRKPERGAFP